LLACYVINLLTLALAIAYELYTIEL